MKNKTAVSVGLCWTAVLFYKHQGFMVLYENRDTHSHEDADCRKRPREARECAKARFFIKNKDSWYYMKTGMLRR